ncbi:MAG: PadR family transcriptional regulator [Bacteroidota bacterium]
MKLLTRAEEFVLLAVWRLQEDAYSIPIRRQLTRITGRSWSLGSVYTPLERLTKKGLVTSRLTGATAQRGGRHKRVYALTERGRQALIRIRTVEDAMWSGVSIADLQGARR